MCVVAFLLASNAYVAFDLFRTEYLSHMESIEAAYIGISRYIVEHGFGLDWFPPWYCGIPFQNTYPPLLHALVAAVSWAARISPAHAHHVAEAALYCVGPALVYLMGRELSGDWKAPAAAALLYSLSTPSAVLSASTRLWARPADPGRFFSLIQFGDGPHVASIMLLPLAILAVHWALEENAGRARLYLAALASAAVVLTNWLGAFAFAMAVISYLMARAALSQLTIAALKRIAVIALLAYGCAMPWIPPSTIGRIQHNAQYVVGHYPMTLAHLVYLAPVLAFAALLWWTLRRFQADLLCGFACLFACFSSTLVLGNDYVHLALMPQPNRYHHEMDLSLSIIAACLAIAMLKRFDRRAVAALLIVAVAVFALQTRHARRRARVQVGGIDITKTVEYQVAARVRDRIGTGRVFAAGSTQFWLNAFVDTPQIGGGFDQGIVNDHIPAVTFGIPWTTGDGADTVAWLRAYGAAAVVVAGPGSRDAYPQNWRDPAKLAGLLPELYRDGGDVVYRVPLRSDSLAHVIRRESAVKRRPASNADLEAIRPLIRDLGDPALPLATMNCTRPGDCVIRGEAGLDHVVFVQITYHRGWRAYVDGEQRPIREDGLGLMVVQPQCSGPCEIRLVYDGGWEMSVAKTAFAASNVLGLAWLVFACLRRRPLNRVT